MKKILSLVIIVLVASCLSPGNVLAYNVAHSLRFNDDDSAYLSKTPSEPSNKETWTFSTWLKRGNFNHPQEIFTAGSSYDDLISLQGSGYIGVYLAYGSAPPYSGTFETADYLNDPSVWYNVVVVVDTSNSVVNDRIKVYINGSEAAAANYSAPSQYYETYINDAQPHALGTLARTGAHYFFDGLLAETHFIDGQALTPENFGQTIDEKWVPKEYTGSYGSNGFSLKFDNTASLGVDSSGNGNNWTTNSLQSTDQLLDSPTNT